jgi:hypothetical protein
MRMWFQPRSAAATLGGSARAGEQDTAPSTSAAPLAPSCWSWRRVALHACALWLASRVALAVFTYFAVLFRASGPATHASPYTLHDLMTNWQRWDALWYIHIAQQGYFTEQATAFFPLYPLLIRGVALLIGGHWLAVALLIADLSALGGFVGVALLAVHETADERTGVLAVRMLAAYPLAFFLAAPYTEGPFLALAAFALLAARLERWRWAATCAFLATLTRPTGVILAAPLVWEYGRQHGWWRRDWWRQLRVRALPQVPQRTLAEALLVVGAVPAGLGAYMLYLWRGFGDPLLFLHAQQHFWRHGGTIGGAAPSAAAAQDVPLFAFTYDQARSLVELGAVAIFLLLTVAAARRMPALYTLYMAGLLLLIVASPRPDRLGIFVSAGRYFVAAIPIFLLLGRWAARRPWLDMLLVGGGFMLQAIFADFFLAGGWMV